MIGLRNDRKTNVNVINQQVNIMLNDGLLNRKAKNMYPHKELNALQTKVRL
jgi:hypothetical protein